MGDRAVTICIFEYVKFDVMNALLYFVLINFL